MKNILRNYEHKAFSDFEDGYAFYTKGFTRNDSEDSGLFYGESLDIITHNPYLQIEMEVNMGEGIIEYSINNKNYGLAFQDKNL